MHRLAVLALMLATSSNALAAELPEYAFLQPTKAKAAGWGWPDRHAFDAVWSEQTRVVRVVRASLATEAGRQTGVFALWPTTDGLRIDLLFGAEGGYATMRRLRGRWQPPARLAEGTLILRSTDERRSVKLEVEYLSPEAEPTHAQLTDWTYVTALLAGGDALYRDPLPEGLGHDAAFGRLDDAKQPAEIRHAIETLLATDASARDHRWATAISRAESIAASDLALAVYRRFRPVGRCSMDDYPATLAKAYADACYTGRDLSCFLKLQVRVMGDQFERVAYSSFGEAAHSTHVDRLTATGVAPDRFLRGLLAQFAGAEREELGLWRLARAGVEAGLESELASAALALAEDPNVDEYNRFRATVLSLYLALKADPSEAAKSKAARVLRARSLSPISRQWLDAFIAS